MARNRKIQSASVRLVPALKAFLLCLLIGGSGIGFVWQKNQIHELGQQSKNREVALAEKKRLNKQRRDKLDELRSPRRLEARIKQLNSGLVLPQQSQIIRLPEPAPKSPAGPSGREALYAKQHEARPASP